MALGALFSQKKPDGEAPGQKNTPQATRQRTMKRAEDYAKEIFGEIQTQTKQQPEKTRQATRKVQETVADPRSWGREAKKEIPVNETIGRLSANQSRTAASAKIPSAADELFPLEKKDLKKSIILAEILMPPKSKR